MGSGIHGARLASWLCGGLLGLCALPACNGLAVQGAPDPWPCTTLEGDVTIGSSADWSAFVAEGCTNVSGRLTLKGPSTLAAPAPALASVGALRIDYDVTLDSASFPSLGEVRGEFDVIAGFATNLGFPALRTVGGTMTTGGGTLTLLDFPALGSVGGGLRVLGGGPTFTFPALATVGGDLVVEGELATFTFPALATVGGGLEVGGPFLARFSFASLATVGRGLFIRPDYTMSNQSLADFSFPLLTAVGGDLFVVSNTALTGLDLPRLMTVGGAMVVQENTALRQCLVDAVERRLRAGPASYVATGNDDAPCP